MLEQDEISKNKSVCYYDDDVKKTQSQIVQPKLATILVKQAKQQKLQEEAAEAEQLKMYQRCKKATMERVKQFSLGFHPSASANERYVNIEGPDPVLDFSFFAVNMHPDFKDMERGLSLIPPQMLLKKLRPSKPSTQKDNSHRSGSIQFLFHSDQQQEPGYDDESADSLGNNQSISQYFKTVIEERLEDLRAEFLILNKITFHEDHARHLIYLKLSEDPNCPETVVCQIEDHHQQNRHTTCLPYIHSQVKIEPMIEHCRKMSVRRSNTEKSLILKQ